jgi:hypothetical protein
LLFIESQKKSFNALVDDVGIEKLEYNKRKVNSTNEICRLHLLIFMNNHQEKKKKRNRHYKFYYADLNLT